MHNYFDDYIKENGKLTPELEETANTILDEVNAFIEQTSDLNHLFGVGLKPSGFPFFSTEDYNDVYNFMKGVATNSPYVKKELRSIGISGMSDTDIALAKTALTKIYVPYDKGDDCISVINSTNRMEYDKLREVIDYANLGWLQTKV
jgi:hypothetical protein